MKILLVSNSDIQGGAARATYRLHQGLKQANCKSHILVQDKLSDDSRISSVANNRLQESFNRTRILLDRLPLKFYPQREKAPFSLQWLPEGVTAKIDRLEPDMINLHWIGGAFLRLETIAKWQQPLVWTLHDMWAFTGGCHYNQNCYFYTHACGGCPQLNSKHQQDLSHWLWQRKQKAFQQTNLTIVTPSKWLGDCAKSSPLLKNRRIEVIPNGIDLQQYRPIRKEIARELLQLPPAKKLILFGAVSATSDSRKGFDLLTAALAELSQSGCQEELELVVFGASKPKEDLELGLKAHYMGQINDNLTLSLIYSAVDVFVAPSRQDNLANTVLEAIACATPCVAFNIGGMPDLIEHQRNGYLAEPYNIGDLTQGIIWTIENSTRHQKLSDRGREKAVREFQLEKITRRYLDLFEEILLGKKVALQEANH